MALGIKFSLNENLFIRDPQDTGLGRDIIRNSIILIDEIGFEDFTFRKLAGKMDSTEASIYRYFKNKHMLLIYLVTWYWEWVSYLIDINMTNITEPAQKLRIAIANIVCASRLNPANDFVNESMLHQIVITEGVKVYHSKSVDEKNKTGFFSEYKQLVEKIAAIILEVNPKFPYPRALASNLFEIVNTQIFYAQHLPRLTDVKLTDDNFEEIKKMMEFMVFRILNEKL